MGTLQSRKSRNPSARSRSNARTQWAIPMPLKTPPSISENPQIWFDYYDRDKNKALSRKELTDALLELNDVKDPYRRQKFLQNIKSLWEEYDADYDGQIRKEDFLKKGGLAERIITFEKMKIQNQIQIKVSISGGMKAHDTIKIISPRTKLPMACSVPEVNEWRTLDGKSYFFLM